jgi:site-specific DNA-cytosine methylase
MLLDRAFVHEALNVQPSFVYGDISDLQEDYPFCYKHGASGKVPRPDVIVCGFPCTTLSAMNQGRKHFAKSGTGASAETFRSLVLAISKLQPDIVIMENVMGLIQVSSETNTSFMTVVSPAIALVYFLQIFADFAVHGNI